MNDTAIATNETRSLIASSKVEGTSVYNLEGEKLGAIENFMVNKRTGQVEYAVLGFGGFLGLGEDHYPLPWDVLTYEPEQEGYVIDLDKDLLKDAPRLKESDGPDFDEAYGRKIYGYYGSAFPMI